jgi:hypothetical protein
MVATTSLPSSAGSGDPPIRADQRLTGIEADCTVPILKNRGVSRNVGRGVLFPEHDTLVTPCALRHLVHEHVGHLTRLRNTFGSDDGTRDVLDHEPLACRRDPTLGGIDMNYGHRRSPLVEGERYDYRSRE